MQPTERIELRRIYPSTAAVFGIIFSAIAAIIFGIIVLIAGFFIPGGIIVGTWQIELPSGIFLLAGASTIALFIVLVVSIIVGSLLSNWLSKMGVRLHMGLAEFEEEVKGKKY